MTALDQKPVLFKQDESLVSAAEYALGDSLENGLDRAEEYAQQFVSIEENSGLALARLLHGVNFRWSEFETEGETFWAWSVRATGRALATIQRRICTWEFLDGEYIPKDYYESIRAFSTKMLAKAYVPFLRHSKNKVMGNYDFVPRDFKVSGKHWLKLSECADESMVMEVVRDITGREHKDRMSFKMDERGVLWVYKGNKYETIGQLFVDSESPLVQEAIADFMESAGITERNDY